VLQTAMATGEKLQPISFRSGGGVTSLLRKGPALFEFIYDSPNAPAAEIWRSSAAATRRDLPIGLIGVTPEGFSLFIDADGVVRAISVGGYTGPIATLSRRDTVASGCAVDDFRAVAYVARNRPDTVLIVTLGEPSRHPVFPTNDPHRESDWSTFRFSGSLGGPCVLWSPQSKRLLLVSDTGVNVVKVRDEHIINEPLGQKLWRWLGLLPPRTYLSDVTSFPGGIAILAAGRASADRQLVDLYGVAGAYLGSIHLERPVIAIAGAPGRLFTVEEERDQFMVASYALPATVRAAAPRRP
jgi:hypothetical protein